MQFRSIFVGVNITFLPMHFLGLRGMPRRYFEYSDQFAFWNFICRYGSVVSFLRII